MNQIGDTKSIHSLPYFFLRLFSFYMMKRKFLWRRCASHARAVADCECFARQRRSDSTRNSISITEIITGSINPNKQTNSVVIFHRNLTHSHSISLSHWTDACANPAICIILLFCVHRRNSDVVKRFRCVWLVYYYIRWLMRPISPTYDDNHLKISFILKIICDASEQFRIHDREE